MSVPVSYPSNLCDLSAEQQHAIEVDKKRWYLARQIRASKSVRQAEIWLRAIANKDHRDDMSRRLNQLAQTDFRRGFE